MWLFTVASLTTLADYLPVRPLVLAVQGALTSASMPERDVAVLLAWCAGGLLMSLVAFRWRPSRTRRHGTSG